MKGDVAVRGKKVQGLMDRHYIGVMVYRCVVLLFCVVLSRILTAPFLSSYQRPFAFNAVEEESNVGVRKSKYVEVPQIIWGLNNQKIALARAALTARKLNRTLLMPKLSASLFYKETDLLEPIDFHRVFSLNRFNSRCRGFVQIARRPDIKYAFVVAKGSGRRWTAEKDMAQLEKCVNSPDIDRHKVIKIEGKHPFLWHDHWPVSDYARVFECLHLVDNLAAEASGVVSKLRRVQEELAESTKIVAVHMRIEKDWMIHCKKWETRAKTKEGKDLRICSSKEEIIQRVGNIPGLQKPCVVYLAVADDLLESSSLLEGWDDGLIPYEKKRLGEVSRYGKYPYLIQSAIDYEVCLQADVFVGNSFSTFSSLIALQRTVRMNRSGAGNSCENPTMATYAYNIEALWGAPQRWATNLSDSSLTAISYGSNKVSCI